MAAEEPSKLDEPEFEWGKKRGFGGKKKDVKFYESFTYDGVEYTLFDSVYLYKEGEPEPYIGKLVKIWETADKAKKVKVLWFFRPCEIQNFLEGCEVRRNELFLACGDGVGLANLNPLDRRKWFKEIPWEERMKTAHERGTLLLLENLDPSLTSEQVQDIIWQGFKESCTARMIQKTACASPHSGQAFVIFKRKETADMVLKKLQEDCLLMSNGCPLVGSIGRPYFPGKKSVFYGHYVLDQMRMLQREMKEAVSTSHCAQPNNIEYDMAMEWCLLQDRADKAWSRLYRRQREELRKLKAKLKTKI
ncbi:hypothetical protein PIB30_014054 [Stylosanthes scabra]|uniref:BAH domain-containing protein n=1 Tax=Stylosanthes scabra TaxID=79078 RepID=A0ABU6Q7K1_9FABA|nr:hypothetical protein [Stylosanthes scabra]